ncbi:unnamed protein product, partial [Owenia fusiformis]
WQLHRANAHDNTIACGVGDCPQMFTPAQVEELAFHRRRHLNLGTEEPSRKKKRAEDEGDGTGQELGVDPASISAPRLQAAVHPQVEKERTEVGGDGTGQELGVDPASISTPQLQAAVHPREEREAANGDQPQVRGLKAGSAEPVLGLTAEEIENLLGGADLGDIDDHIDVDLLLNFD